MPQSVQDTLQDPRFYGLPVDQQKIVLQKLDPNFSSLPSAEQDNVLISGQEKFGPSVNKNPPTFGEKVKAKQADIDKTLNTPVGPGWRGEVQNFGQTAARTLIAPVVHPGETAAGIFESAGTLGIKPIIDESKSVKSAYRQGGLARALSTLLGQAAGMALQAGVAEAVPEVARSIPEAGKRVVEGATKTTPKETAGLVKETQAENVAATEKADVQNAKQIADRAKELVEHHEKMKAAEEANRAAKEPVERKAALERGVQRLDQDFQDNLKQTAERVRQEAGKKYDAVRAATAGKSVPASDLVKAVKSAESKLQGSSENIKVFRDILQKAPEGGEDTVLSGGMKFGPGTRVYESVKASAEGVPAATEPVPFNDLQGYYTELGSKLSSGNLPGDVYLATKALQDSVGEMMQKVADESGVGPQLREARAFYRGYMQTFRDHASPLYKAIKATERGKSIAELSGKDQTGIQALAQYNPELARTANTIRGYQAEAKSLSAKPKSVKPTPELGPKSPPIEAQLKKIGPEEVRSAKQAGLEHRVNRIRARGEWIATGATGYRLLSSLLHGNLDAIPADIFEGGVALGGVEGVSRLLENPRIARLLTNPTPRDIAQIPPEMRADFGDIIAAARKNGLRVSPAILALGMNSSRPQHPTLSAASPVQ